MEIIKIFYDKFDKKLIADYVFGNERIESAIINLGAFIPVNSKKILDLGCGIGWSTHEFANSFCNAEVRGIDLSPNLIRKAKILFNAPNLSFKTLDITKKMPDDQFDSIIMIDVYEHIPVEKRNEFHRGLKKMLGENGRLILACPTKHHQNWLRETNPEALQPVDEDIDFKVINNLAQEVGGEVIFFEYKKIWKNYDYLYTVIEIDPLYNSTYSLQSGLKIDLENREKRRERVWKRLKLDMRQKEKKKSNMGNFKSKFESFFGFIK